MYIIIDWEVLKMKKSLIAIITVSALL